MFVLSHAEKLISSGFPELLRRWHIVGVKVESVQAERDVFHLPLLCARELAAAEEIVKDSHTSNSGRSGWKRGEHRVQGKDFQGKIPAEHRKTLKPLAHAHRNTDLYRQRNSSHAS